jgi:hypothetical protein
MPDFSFKAEGTQQKMQYPEGYNHDEMFPETVPAKNRSPFRNCQYVTGVWYSRGRGCQATTHPFVLQHFTR